MGVTREDREAIRRICEQALDTQGLGAVVQRVRQVFENCEVGNKEQSRLYAITYLDVAIGRLLDLRKEIERA